VKKLIGPEDVLGGFTSTLRCREKPPSEEEEVFFTCGTLTILILPIPEDELDFDPDFTVKLAPEPLDP